VDRMHQTSRRVSQILDVNRSRATRVWKPALYSVAAFSLVCLVSLSQAPELVAFEDRMPVVTVASSALANETLTSAAGSNFLEKQPFATPVTFRAKSPAETLLQPNRVREGTSSLVPPMAEGKSALKPVKRAMSTAVKAAPARRDYAAHRSATRLEARFVSSSARQFAHVRSTVSVDEASPHAIFVVMQSAQFDEAGPMFWSICVWHVTVLDSRGIPVAPRIPAKQI
jgi:hypothetical protein